MEIENKFNYIICIINALTFFFLLIGFIILSNLTTELNISMIGIIFWIRWLTGPY